jgi:phage tail protein X
MYYRNTGELVFKNRPRMNFNLTNADTKIYSEGDRLDLIAYNYYNDSQLWWVILDANPMYSWEGEIPYGTPLIIPNISEVSKCLQY